MAIAGGRGNFRAMANGPSRLSSRIVGYARRNREAFINIARNKNRPFGKTNFSLDKSTSFFKSSGR